MYINATTGVMEDAIGWLSSSARANSGNARLIFYYAGHGMPSESDRRAYLLPSDASLSSQRAWIPLYEIYNELGSIQAKSVTVMLDACFSGTKRGTDENLVAARGVAMRVKEEELSGKLVVFSAASGDEMAHAFRKRNHGMFTYFLLNQLAKTKGGATYGELFEGIKAGVAKYSWNENEKIQTPSVSTSPEMRDIWKQLKF